jgi:hypothetical protein
MEVKQCHKPSPNHHNFYWWYVETIPSHGWFMVLFYLQLAGPPCKIQDQIIRFGGRTEGPPWGLEVGDRGHHTFSSQ